MLPTALEGGNELCRKVSVPSRVASFESPAVSIKTTGEPSIEC